MYTTLRRKRRGSKDTHLVAFTMVEVAPDPVFTDFTDLHYSLSQ
ncbi:MAG: hypothetical protein WC314_05285 [Vulcanimicrobiota bacterium]